MSGIQRYPRSIVTVNGVRMDYISWEVNNNGYYQADTFTARLPLAQTQPSMVGPPLIRDAAWWSQRRGIDVKIYDGVVTDPQNFSLSELTFRLQGVADTVEVDPIQKTVRITGRDYAAVLIDTQITLNAPKGKTVSGMSTTASKVAVGIAKECGLIPNVTPTRTKIGKYYGSDPTKATTKSAWDILCELAHFEQFIVYVSGQTLNFVPLPDPAKPRVLTLDDSQRITTGPTPALTFTHSNLSAVNGIVVKVQSWDDKTKRTVTKTAEMKWQKDDVSPLRNRPPLLYIYKIPNLTPDAAQQKADAHLKAITRHESQFMADDMPGDPTLNPYQPIKWNYAGTLFQQIYYLDSVTRRFDFETGYTMSLRGKNQAVGSAIQTPQRGDLALA
jgi:phage protein D